MPTDYHTSCRAAVLEAMQTALVDYTAFKNTETDGEWRIKAVDDIGNFDVSRAESMPCVMVAAIAPEIDRPALATNIQDGIGYSVVVAMFAAGVANGEKSPGIPTPTEFRRIIRTTFHNKRLTGVAQVAWCEVGEAGGQLFDKRNPAWQRMAAAMVVTCNGRWPRS